MCSYKCLHIYNELFEKGLNEGEDHFLPPSPMWGNFIFFFSTSFSPSVLLSSSLASISHLSAPRKAERSDLLCRLSSTQAEQADLSYLFLLLDKSTWEGKIK